MRGRLCSTHAHAAKLSCADLDCDTSPAGFVVLLWESVSRLSFLDIFVLVNLSQPHSTVVLQECRLQGKYHPRTAAGSSFETHRCSCTLSAMISRVSHMCTLLQHIPTVSVHHYLFISFWCIASLIGPRSFQPHDQDSCTEHNASHHSTSC